MGGPLINYTSLPTFKQPNSSIQRIRKLAKKRTSKESIDEANLGKKSRSICEICFKLGFKLPKQGFKLEENFAISYEGEVRVYNCRLSRVLNLASHHNFTICNFT